MSRSWCRKELEIASVFGLSDIYEGVSDILYILVEMIEDIALLSSRDADSVASHSSSRINKIFVDTLLSETNGSRAVDGKLGSDPRKSST